MAEAAQKFFSGDSEDDAEASDESSNNKTKR